MIESETPSWMRRGHTRKPNWVVRALYWIFDWFGDFGPMFRSMGRGIGKTARGTWDFLVKAVMLTINLVLVVGIIYLSVQHSYRLLIYAGLKPGLEAFVGVGIFETVFVYCSVAIDIANKRGRRATWAWVAFLIGFIFVEVSNYTGMADNWVGRAVGITIPFLLLVMKKVLEQQFKKEDKPSLWSRFKSWFKSWFRRKETQTVVQDGTKKEVQSVPDPVQNEPASVVQSGTEKEEEMVPDVVEKETRTTDEANHSVVHKPNHNHPETEPVDGAGSEPEEKEEPSKNETHEVEETVENKEETADEVVPRMVEEEVIVEDKEEENQNLEPNHTIDSETAEPEPSVVEELNHTMVQKETETVPSDEEKPNHSVVQKEVKNVPLDEEKLNHTMVQNPTTDEHKTKPQTTRKKTTTKSKKSTKRSSNKDVDPEVKKVLRDAKKWGKKYFEENGKSPGRVMCSNRYTHLNQRQARELAGILRRELGLEKAS
jgi:hypothetical protein